MVGEGEEVGGKYDWGVGEMKRGWSDVWEGGSMRKVREFGGKGGKEEERGRSMNDVDMCEVMMRGKGE